MTRLLFLLVMSLFVRSCLCSLLPFLLDLREGRRRLYIYTYINKAREIRNLEVKPQAKSSNTDYRTSRAIYRPIFAKF